MSGVRSKCEKNSNGHNSATRHPIDFVFGSGLGFSGTADRTAPFPVGSNPRWRPVVFSKDGLALFNLTAHELHELYYVRPTS